MDNASLAVEIPGGHLEKLVVSFLELPPQRIRNEVGVLDQARRLRIHEKRNVSQVPRHASPMPFATELGREGLQARLLSGLVEND